MADAPLTADPPYPAHWEADAVLSDGGTVHLRPITPDDADRLRRFHGRLSPETVYNRFFTMMRTLPARDVERFTTVDHDDRAAVVALLQGEIVGVVRYDRYPGSRDAEVAVVVEDAHQGRGLGSLLLEHLASAARERGIETFVADVLPSNRRMLHVFQSVGFELSRSLADGYVELSFPITETETSREIARSREHRAEARSVARLLAPKAVAVVGASRVRGTAGHEVFRRLREGGFEGPVYPVNPNAPHVGSVRAYADVRDVPDDVDLVVVAVPAPLVAEVVRACSAKRVRGLVVVSGGFADAGEEGRARLAEVVRLARDGGMRLIGPNAMGVVNTDPAVRLFATFAEGDPPRGRVGVFTQSGALAATFLELASRRSLGLSTFVSIGDRADVSGNDLLQYWQQDVCTDVVALHLQGFGNPRKFARIARGVGRSKPVVALKSGRGRDSAVDAMFRGAGVVRVDTLAQLFDTTQLLATQPLPAGPRVGIVGTSSALAVMAADSCEAVGLRVPELSAPVQAGLAGAAGRVDVANPVDLGPVTEPEALTEALRTVASSGEFDALLVLVTPHPRVAELAAGVMSVAADSDLPVLASFLGRDGVPAELSVPGPDGVLAGRGSVPSYASPESAALALARAWSYASWRARPVGEVPDVDVDLRTAVDVVTSHPHDGQWLPLDVTRRLLSSVGLHVHRTARVGTLSDAVAAAEELGWPVAIKSTDERWRGRVDVGAVRLDVEDPEELALAWREVEARVGPGEVFVQPMARSGVSVVVRLVQDPAVGPLLSLRLGGVVADHLADPHVVTLPLTDRDAFDLVRRVRGSGLLLGSLGGPRADVEALEDLLHRVAALADDVPEVAEVLLDPVLVGETAAGGGIVLLHAGVKLLPPALDPEAGPRRLIGTAPALLR